MSTPLPQGVQVPAADDRIAETCEVGAWPGAPDDRLRFERMLADLSARFVSLPPPHVDAAIEEALRRVVEALDLDRSVLFILPDEGYGLTSVRAWTRAGFAPPRLGDLSQWYPWAIARLTRGERVVFSSIDELPPEASIDKASWQLNGVRSHASLPLSVAGKVVGALTFAALRREREWPVDLLNRLRLVVEILGNALARKQSQEELEKLLAFERLLSEVAASLVSHPARRCRGDDPGCAAADRALSERGSRHVVEARRRSQAFSLHELLGCRRSTGPT